MKITWLGARTFRLYVGGRIIVTEAAGAEAVDPAEVAAGADDRIAFDTVGADLPALPPGWHPARPQRLIDGADTAKIGLFAFAGRGLLVDEADEGPVIIAPAGIEWSRIADGAVTILFGAPDTVTDSAVVLLDRARPRLLALAVTDIADDGFARIAAAAGRCAVQLLEPGLAVEA